MSREERESWRWETGKSPIDIDQCRCEESRSLAFLHIPLRGIRADHQRKRGSVGLSRSGMILQGGAASETAGQLGEGRGIKYDLM